MTATGKHSAQQSVLTPALVVRLCLSVVQPPGNLLGCWTLVSARPESHALRKAERLVSCMLDFQLEYDATLWSAGGLHV
jgi:hypothetical protein